MLEKKTKIICTIGPSSEDYPTLKKLADSGMNVARLNFSHGDYTEHSLRISNIRKLNKEGYNIGILLDTKGPEIRLCKMENNGVYFEQGDFVKMSMEPVSEGNKEIISVSYPELINKVKVGTIIKVDDGKMNFEVVSINKKNKYIELKAMNSYLLKSRKSVGVPFTKLNLPFISNKDYEDLLFACKNKVDYIAASFTRNKQDILDLKKVLKDNNGENIRVLAKIENIEGVENIEEILQVSDGIMVARGDLGIELNFEDVPIIQKRLIRLAREAGKICIIATQMLDSMQDSPAPTRAEVSDIANAVYHVVDAIMLSGETASGKYPVESCAMEASISKRIEQEIDYPSFTQASFKSSKKDSNDSIAFSVASTAYLNNSKLIICFSKTGNTARRVSFFRPNCPIISISDDEEVKGKLSLNYGIYGIYKKNYKISFDSYEKVAIEVAKEFGVKEKENIILTCGDRVGGTNTMKIVQL